MLRFFSMLCLCFLAAAMGAPGATASNKGQSVELSGTAGKTTGYLALPKDGGKAKKPAVIVIQEWWGVNDWVKGVTERFAERGEVALAVDLYRGKVAANPDEAHELMRGLPDDRAISDLKAAFDYLAKRPDVDAAKIGAVGWCMGGGLALDFAVNEPRLRAVVMNYGNLLSDPQRLAAIKAPLMGNFGADDSGIPVADIKAFEAAMRKAGKTVDIKIYEQAGHGFMNPNSKGHKEAAASDAWSRIDGFFRKHLAG